MKAGTNLIVDLSPLILGEIGNQPLNSLDESERHRSFVYGRRWDKSQAGSGLMGDQSELGTLIVPDVSISEG